jgi:hypothetical protein
MYILNSFSQIVLLQKYVQRLLVLVLCPKVSSVLIFVLYWIRQVGRVQGFFQDFVQFHLCSWDVFEATCEYMIFV